jgi:uncharacterized protein YneF (UPF0154 family)
MTETQIRLTIAIIAFFFGVIIGYFLWHKKGDHSKGLTALQILSVFVFFGYIGFEAIIGKEPSDLVATAILTMIGGEIAGKFIADKVVKK